VIYGPNYPIKSIDGPNYFQGRQWLVNMGRKRINEEKANARFPAGTLARIDAVLKDDERLADFLRRAVERELARRERDRK
jgi:hypothetical protein